MNRTQAALLASLSFAAGGASTLAVSQPGKPSIEVVNVKLVKNEQPDGGWNARACGYTKSATGEAGEVCWHVPVSATVAAPLVQTILDQRK